MKIIEGLKKIKDLQRKAEDIRKKIATYCASLDSEVPEYGTVEQQTKQVSGWLQSHSDILKEIEGLRVAIQRTNLLTEVPIEIVDGKFVTKTIAAWIHRRRDLAKLDGLAWQGLTNRNLKPQNYKADGTEEIKIANVRKYYSQQERDFKVEEYASEPSRIDSTLEITNATTDLII